MRLFVVTDAWHPQVNGVVRTLEILEDELRRRGHYVRFATPENHLTVPMPTYPEIKLSLFPRRELERAIRDFHPDAIHIATEGPLGLSARAICLKWKLPFTTSFHTRFPDYVRARFPFISERIVYRVLRWFHAPALAMMVATQSLKAELERHGFGNVKLWSRGVDVNLFHPREKTGLGYTRPIFLYVGRIAVEKNVEAFLALDLPGTKVVIGEGPQRSELERKYPKTKFLGVKTGEDLARHYAASDVFVFPSCTDTFGLVLLEALASGVPVAAYPAQAPMNVVGSAPVAVLDEDLGAACLRALAIPPEGCRRFALDHSWHACTEQFLANLALEAQLDSA
ncbi:MAG: glycosyltransferase family 4 protein [Alphaproteobacteria bacterium]